MASAWQGRVVVVLWSQNKTVALPRMLPRMRCGLPDSSCTLVGIVRKPLECLQDERSLNSIITATNFCVSIDRPSTAEEKLDAG